MSEIVESTSRTVEELNGLSREQLLDRFLELEPPTAAEFDGEFDGHGAPFLPNLDDYYRSVGLGAWLGKGYRLEPHRDWQGHGYNLWRTDDGVIRCFRFGWGLGTSMLDGRGCLVMHYSAFANHFGSLDLIDEIRRVEPGVYLGLASTREPSPLSPERGGPQGRALPSSFLLVGPCREWVGPDRPDAELE